MEIGKNVAILQFRREFNWNIIFCDYVLLRKH